MLGVAGASAAALPPEIAVTIESVADTQDDGAALQLKFVYANTASYSVTFLKRGTALEGAIREDILEIHIGGLRLPYVGPVFKRRPPSAGDYLTLAAGESRSVTVVIDRVYDFDQAGEYSIRARRGHGLVTFGDSITMRVTRGRQLLKQPPAFQSCNSGQQSQADAALSLAESYAATARNDLRDTPLNLRPEAVRYAEWFGNYGESRWNTVQSTFDKIYTATSARTITFDCACAEGDQNTFAYVYPNQPYDIYLCPVFWQVPTGGENSKAGTIIHELSHFVVVASTIDHVYGVSDCRALALSDPNRAVKNADSLEYFAENPNNLGMPSPLPPEPGPEPVPVPEPEPDYSYLQAIFLLLLQDL